MSIKSSECLLQVFNDVRAPFQMLKLRVFMDPLRSDDGLRAESLQEVEDKSANNPTELF